MKDYIIIPVNQTQGMEGYSAITIERTTGNLEDFNKVLIDNVNDLCIK